MFLGPSGKVKGTDSTPQLDDSDGWSDHPGTLPTYNVYIVVATIPSEARSLPAICQDCITCGCMILLTSNTALYSN